MNSYRTIWPYFKEKWPFLVIGVTTLILCDLLQLLAPMVVGQSIDLLAGLAVPRAALANKALILLGLALAVAASRFVWRRLVIGFSRLIERELRARLYAKLMALPLSWHQKKTSGELMALATNDVESIRQAVSLGMISLIDAVVMGTVAMFFMFTISPKLMLLALLPMPLISIATKLFSRSLFRSYLSVQESFGTLTESVREELSGIRVLKAMALEPLALERTQAASLVNLKQNVRLSVLSGAFFPFMTFLTQVAVATVLYFGGRQAVLGEITPGNFVAFISYLGLLSWPMMALGMVFNLIQRGSASLARINLVLNEPLERPVLLEVIPPAPRENQPFGVEVKNLTFNYASRPQKVLDNLSLAFPPGQISALVGPTGAGKSTLAALIPGLITPPPQALALGGRWLEDWDLGHLRARIGYVPQDGYTFSGTIYENLVFGRPQATKDEAWEAAKIAGLASDLLSFPKGLDTWVGERGVTLSGGQRQRMALARAMILSPDLLILDDTFSAVDATVEEEILTKLRPLRQGRTTLVISHRLTSLAGADNIFVLEEGRLSASGSLAELITGEGYFKRIWTLQMAGAGRKKNL